MGSALKREKIKGKLGLPSALERAGEGNRKARSEAENGPKGHRDARKLEKQGENEANESR